MISCRSFFAMTRRLISCRLIRDPACRRHYRSLHMYELKLPKHQNQMRFPSSHLHSIFCYSTLPEDVPASAATNPIKKYSYQVLRFLPEYKDTFFDENTSLSLDIIEDFQKHVVDFIEISTRQDCPCITNESLGIVISNVLSNLKTLSDKEIFAILFYMAKVPGTRDVNNTKYMDIWKKLDNECYRRLPGMDFDTMLQVNDLFFNLKLNRKSLFHWNAVKRLLRKCDVLPRVHFMRLMMCLSSSSTIHPNIKLYILEFNMHRLIESLSAEEIAVAADTFNKLNYSIANKDFFATILDTVAKDAKAISSSGVVQISALVHRCSHYKMAHAVYNFQEAMLTEVDRLTPRGAVYLGLIGTRVLHPHEELIQRVISKVTNNFSHLSLYDIVKLSQIISSFDTKCDELCHMIVQYLRTPNPDLEQPHNACHIPKIVNFLSMKGFIYEDLIAKILSMEFLTFCYDNVMYRFKPELLFCDLTATIELENYQGPRLTEKQRGFLLKSYMFWLNWLALPPKKSEPEYKRFVRSFSKTTEEILGGSQFFFMTNVLPQFEFADAVFCTDSSGSVIEIPQCYLRANEEFAIKLIPEEIELNGVNLHVVMLVNRSGCNFNSHKLSGQLIMQRRQIEKLGYKTHQIFGIDWLKLTDDAEKHQFLNEFFTSIGIRQNKQSRGT